MRDESEEKLVIYGVPLRSRLFIGSARYPSPDILRQVVESSGASILTVSLRRHTMGGTEKSGAFWDWLRTVDARLLPNTAGCRTARQAVQTAQAARELFDTRWIKLEVIADDYTLQPDPFELVEAARILSTEGFEVFPYMTDDLRVAERLMEAGCRVLMPWGSPIGSGRGVVDPHAVRAMRARFPEAPIVLDAGIGRPSHATHALELGCDAVLVNTALALASDPVRMGRAFGAAVEAGRLAYLSVPMQPQDFAVPSTPVVGIPFSGERNG